MLLRLFNYELRISRKALTLTPIRGSRGGGWWSFGVVREPYMGAWQENQEITTDTALSNVAVFSCVTLIAADVAKLLLRLVKMDANGIWHEAENPAYSPVLRKPNRYQTIVKFIEQWITSKLVHGNTYALIERDQRGVVRALYVLDPTRVVPLVAPDGAVYYELRRDDLSGLAKSGEPVTVPASEIIHDMMIPLFHPLIGVSPLYACGLSALQGLTMQKTSNKFFAGGAAPGGVLTAPGAIADDTAKRLKDYWDQNFTGDNVGKVAVLGDGLKYEALTVNAADAQLIEQLRWTAETICSCYHVPAFKVGVGPPPPYNSVDALNQQYYSDCIQSLLRSLEAVLDEGLGLQGTDYGTEFDIDDLIWLDTSTRTKAAAEAIGSGAVAPNEARRKWFGLGPVDGGDTPYMQVQNYALSALAARDNNGPPSSGPAPSPAPPPTLPPADDVDETKELAALTWALLRKDWSGLTNAI